MALTQGCTDAFAQTFLNGTYMLALYTPSATLGSSTTAYTATNEVSSPGYTAGGIALTVTVSPVTSNGVTYISFAPAVWSGVTFTARGGLIYDTTRSNLAVAVLNFGADKVATNQTFTVTFPAATYTSAIIRIKRGA